MGFEKKKPRAVSTPSSCIYLSGSFPIDNQITRTGREIDS